MNHLEMSLKAFFNSEAKVAVIKGNWGVSTTDSDQPLGVEIALITEDVNLAHSNALEHGAKELKKPEQKPWGQSASYVRCPSGILLELCTPIG